MLICPWANFSSNLCRSRNLFWKTEWSLLVLKFYFLLIQIEIFHLKKTKRKNIFVLKNIKWTISLAHWRFIILKIKINVSYEMYLYYLNKLLMNILQSIHFKRFPFYWNFKGNISFLRKKIVEKTQCIFCWPCRAD